ncbi:MAG: hypothetical protein RL172_1846 [Bacteroidota bacterium]|jgi:glycosyltransferase involved in cell wall biosynthesis
MYPVSVILPVYNGIRYLEECVASVLTQDFADFEFLIIDDCSTDSSYQFLTYLKDPRIKLYQNRSNKGLFYNLNFLADQSKGALIKLWSQDDIMYPGCIAEIVAFHQQHPGLGFSYTNRHHIDGNGQKLALDKADNTPAIISTELHSKIAFITGSIAGNISNVTITREAFIKTGPFNEQMKISGDFEMWVRLAEHFKTGFINQPLIQLRNHKGQLSNQEQYFLYHLKEDLQVYNYLLGYVSPSQAAEGRSMLRHQKLLFYYTLMVKAALKGKFKNAASFFKIIAGFDNMLLLTSMFIKYRIFRVKPTFDY